jgi:hypothetical protein
MFTIPINWNYHHCRQLAMTCLHIPHRRSVTIHNWLHRTPVWHGHVHHHIHTNSFDHYLSSPRNDHQRDAHSCLYYVPIVPSLTSRLDCGTTNFHSVCSINHLDHVIHRNPGQILDMKLGAYIPRHVPQTSSLVNVRSHRVYVGMRDQYIARTVS